MGVHDKEFCASVVWPARPVWELENNRIKLLIKPVNSSRDHNYNFTDGLKDPQTDKMCLFTKRDLTREHLTV